MVMEWNVLALGEMYSLVAVDDDDDEEKKGVKPFSFRCFTNEETLVLIVEFRLCSYN